MHRKRSILGGLLAAAFVGVATSAVAAPLNWEGTASASFGADIPPIPLSGGGVATVNALSGGVPGHLQTLRLKGSRGGITGSASFLVTDPDVADNGIGGVILDWQGGTGTLAPVSGAVASNTVLTQNQIPLRGVIKICLLDPSCGAFLELEMTVPTTTPSSNVGSAIVGVGVGGTVTGTAASFTGTTPPIQYTLEGAPWTPKTASVVDQVETTGGNSVFTTATLQGWAHGPASATTSTAAVNGVLQIVTPVQISTDFTPGTIEKIGASVALQLRFVPEPGLLLLLGSGALGLAALGRGRRRRS